MSVCVVNTSLRSVSLLIMIIDNASCYGVQEDKNNITKIKDVLRRPLFNELRIYSDAADPLQLRHDDDCCAEVFPASV